MKDVFKILIAGSVGVAVVAIIVIIMVQIDSEERIAKQQHPCYQLYIQLQEIRDEMVEIERFTPELLGEFEQLAIKWIVENRCGSNLEEWADEKIIAEIDSLGLELEPSP